MALYHTQNKSWGGMTELNLHTSRIKIVSFGLESMTGKKSNSKAIFLPLVPTKPDFSVWQLKVRLKEMEKNGVFLQCI